MKKRLLILMVILRCFTINISAQTPKIFITPNGTGYGDSWVSAGNANNIPVCLNYCFSQPQLQNYYGGVEIYFAGGDYYNVSINLSGLIYTNITDIHLLGGFNPSQIGNTTISDRDWNAYPTIFHADANNPSSRVINLDNFSLSSQDEPSTVASIIVTSDDSQMTSNAINLLAGNYVVSNCEITEYNTTNILLMLEIGYLNAYVISSLIDNNTSGSLLGFFGNIQMINTTIADNTHSYFMAGLTYDAEILNCIIGKNSNFDFYNFPLAHAYVSHSFVANWESYMSDDNTNQWGVDPYFTYDIGVPYTCDPASTIFNYGDGSYLTSTGLMPDLYEYDIDHNERFYDLNQDTVDAGDYQHYYYDGWANYEEASCPVRSRKSLRKHTDDTSSNNVKLWSYKNVIYIYGDKAEGATVSVYTTAGELVYSTRLHSSQNTITTYLSPGEYVAVSRSASGEELVSKTIILW